MDAIKEKLYGDGEWVALVKALCGLSSRATGTWKAGLKVQGAAPGAIARGTAIATFVKGAYPTDENGKHAAIGKRAKAASPRTIGFNSKAYSISSQFFLVAYARIARAVRRVTIGTALTTEGEHEMSRMITINFEASGEGVLVAKKMGDFRCLGRPTFPYKPEVTVNPAGKFRVKRSDEFGVDMPWAILIHWERGVYIHEMPATLATNGGPTAGCIHLDKGDAEKVWRYVSGSTRVLIRRPW